jgi:hypothetical protein
MCHGPKAAPFNEDRLLVEDLGWLKYFTALPKHDRVREFELHQVKRHQAIVDLLEAMSRKAQHVDLYPVRTEVILERFN